MVLVLMLKVMIGQVLMVIVLCSLYRWAKENAFITKIIKAN